MKTTIASLLTALFAALFVPASPAETPSLSGSFTTKYATGYPGKIGVMFSRDPVLVNSLDINVGEDWTFEIWSSTSLGKEKYGDTFGDEIDLFAMWHHTYGNIRLSATAGYFAIKDLDELDNDLYILEGEVSYVECSYLQPYLCTRYFGELTSKSPETGWFLWAGVRGSLDIGIPRTKVTYDLSGAYSDGALGRTPGLVFGRAVIGLPVQVSERVTFTPSILLQTPFPGQRSNAFRYTDQNEVVGSFAFSVAF